MWFNCTNHHHDDCMNQLKLPCFSFCMVLLLLRQTSMYKRLVVKSQSKRHTLFFFFFWPSESQGYKGCSRQIIHLILIHDLEKRKKMNKVRHIKATDTFKHSFQRSPSFPSSCLSYKWKSFEFLATLLLVLT